MLGVGLLIVATGLNWLYAVRLSTINAGRRLPIVTGQYPIRPPLRVSALRGVGAGVSILGALILAQELWFDRPLLGSLLGAVLAVSAIVVPALIATVAHNGPLRARPQTKA